MINLNKIFDNHYLTNYAFKEADTEYDMHLVQSKLKMTTSGVYVDLGCGYGRVSNPLIDQGYNIQGIDGADWMIHEARKIYPDQYIHSQFNDIQDNIASSSLDGVYSLYSSIGHISKSYDQETFRQTSMCLKSGSYFLLEYENFVARLQRSELLSQRYFEHNNQRRLIQIETNLITMQVSIKNELRDMQTNKLLKDRDFTLELYTYHDLKLMGQSVGLELVEITGRTTSYTHPHRYENQAFFLFKKK